MSRFDEGKKKRVDIGDGDWVELPEVVSYDMAEKITAQEGTIETLKAMLLGWNLKDSEGKEMPVSEESLKKLDIRTVGTINRKIDELFTIPKAQPPTSGEK